jgi:hypothetical protein
MSSQPNSPDKQTAVLGLLDVLIVEHRDRSKALRDRYGEIQTRLGTMVTAVVALAAFLAPRLPYDRFTQENKIEVGVASVGALVVLVAWIDTLGGPARGALKPFQTRVEGARSQYEDAREQLDDPLKVRKALLERLVSEEAMALKRLQMAEGHLRFAAFALTLVVMAMSFLAIDLAL